VRDVLTVAVLAAFGGAAAAQAPLGPTSTAAGIFTQAQADRGVNGYRASCQRCHGTDLNATNPEAPNLTGPAFGVTWVGHTMQERYERVRYTMPVDSPDTLPPQTYMDIIAFILSYNGIPAGDQELTPETPGLDQIVIEAP
jgi:hypothetical protein